MVEIDLSVAHFNGLSLHVVFMLIPMLHDHKRESHGAILKTLAEIADAGEVKPVIEEPHFSIADIDLAYDRLSSGKAIGSTVMDI